MPQQFASDNNAGMCPEALAALQEANSAPHAGGYGDDAWTARAVAAIEQLFECRAKVFFAGNGTAGATGDATLVGGPAGEASDAAEASPVVLDASAAEETAAVTASGREISHFDLAAELSDDLGLDASAPAGQPTSSPWARSV